MVERKLSRGRIAVAAVGLLALSQAVPKIAHQTPAYAVGSRSAAGAPGDSGDVKISETTVPDHGNQGNEPHVQCGFYVLGFNLVASQGTLTVDSWAPTGDGAAVLTDGYTGTADDAGTYQFVNGPYSLPAGHYKVFVTDNKGASITKKKVFWVDSCPTPPTPPTPTPPPCTDSTSCGFGVPFSVSRHTMMSRPLRQRLTHAAHKHTHARTF